MQKLGFGMMRLPMPDPKEQNRVDEAQVCAMVDRFLERGYTYFDTAYMYHGGESENVVRRTLVERHPRERFLLADKMPLFHFRPEDTEEEQAALFQEQLDKCGVTYFDYYLLHSVTAAGYEIARRLRTFEFLAEQKAQGRIRRLGFSFHDKADVLDRILTEHPEVEFVQLQLNYLDWEDERVQSRKCYETVRRHGKQVVVMEPVKGGKLAKLPEEAAAILRQAHPDWSPASWAIRFAAGLEGVVMVLSGMSDMSQLEENTAFMAAPAPLTGEERALLAQVAELLSALAGPLGCHVNLIPMNPVREYSFQGPDRTRIRAFQNRLEKNKINGTIRREMGRDIDGACGQLRRRSMSDFGGNKTC